MDEDEDDLAGCLSNGWNGWNGCTKVVMITVAYAGTVPPLAHHPKPCQSSQQTQCRRRLNGGDPLVSLSNGIREGDDRCIVHDKCRNGISWLR